jgi:hypothetical protein
MLVAAAVCYVSQHFMTDVPNVIDDDDDDNNNIY